MRLLIAAMICLCVLAGTAYAQNTSASGAGTAAAPAVALDAKNAKAIGSYAIGRNVARNLRGDGLEIDLESFIQGLRDGVQNAKSPYSDQQMNAAVEAFQRDVQAKQQQRQQAAGDKNRTEGQAFLAANKTKTGVTTLPSGLQYQVTRSGNGPSPKRTDTVKVHYEGKLLDGTVFDSSYQRNQPTTFRVDQVIPGWTESLQLMKVGDKWRIFVPSDLAYGPTGAGNVIGPNAVLTFDVELLDVEPSGAK